MPCESDTCRGMLPWEFTKAEEAEDEVINVLFVFGGKLVCLDGKMNACCVF